jgi:tetratricopeptide (TPR) repeat protein
MDHGKRAVSSFPLATGVYYRVNYAPGTDIARYKNLAVPTSFMAHHSDFDFLGYYDHGQHAGMLHVANHHVAPGKKQWTWGHGDFGRAWDRQLTDEDGPYVELMCGAYSDNQPDFSWIMPGEERCFTQVFLPYKLIGPASNASAEAVIRLAVRERAAEIGVYVTRARSVVIQLLRDRQMFFEHTVALSPEMAYGRTVPLPAPLAPQRVTLRMLSDGHELLAFTPLPDEQPPLPAPAAAARPPAEIQSNEELFLNGLHLEQYRHGTFEPEPYYVEALRRDPLDSRCHNALGRLLYRRGRFVEAEGHFRRAIESLTRRNPNPYDGEPYYQLGLALRMQGRHAEAYAAFYKAVWSAAWQDAGYFELARLACHAGRREEAWELIERALARNTRHAQAQHLKIALLRTAGRRSEALRLADEALSRDPLDFGALNERRRLSGTAEDEALQALLMRDNSHTYVEIAVDYAHAGLFDDAIELLRRVETQGSRRDPLVAYFIGWFLASAGQEDAARVQYAQAASRSPDYCFPHALECVPALETGLQLNPTDPRAPYYLGNFWYAHRRPEEAIAAWETARERDPALPSVHRNLALAYYNERQNPGWALASMERAFALDATDARVLFELDQLLALLNRSPGERLALLERHAALVDERDDLSLERILLLNALGRHAEALARVLSHTFHPREGGEGQAAGQYVLSLVELARERLHAGASDAAVELLDRAKTYPPSLGEGKPFGARENHVDYYLSVAAERRGQPAEARACLERAAEGVTQPTSAPDSIDEPPLMIYYQGLALRKLGREAEARRVFEGLVEYGAAHLDDAVALDYFAVSLAGSVFRADDQRRHRVHCLYMCALGQLGRQERAAAADSLGAVLAADAAHVGAAVQLRMLESGAAF